MSPTYDDFLAEKVSFDRSFGFDVDEAEINPLLKPHQVAIVRWAVAGGRRAIFAAFGLGKTFMQLETLRLIQARTHQPVLIVLPLGVRQEFRLDADKLGIRTKFIRRTEEIAGEQIYLTNYESVRDGKVAPQAFAAVSLDEASVLRSFGSKTYQTFLTLFDDVPYRFVATATPSPNRYKELIHYAGYLGIMDTGQALTRFFQRDSTKANNLTLYPHKQREFWLWLNTWAVFLQRPSDLGFADTGYVLPDIEIVYHEIDVDHSTAAVERDGQHQMFRGGQLGVVDAAREKRATLEARVAKAAELVTASPDDHFILWHDLEDERRAIKQLLPEAVEVYGTLDLDTREDRIIDFSEGRIRLLATKPELSGAGCNFQRHCHRAVFVGIGFSFHDFIQAVHRLQRFLQPHQVRIDIIYAESEREILRTLLARWAQHVELAEQMSQIIRDYGLNPLAGVEARRGGCCIGCTHTFGEDDDTTATPALPAALESGTDSPARQPASAPTPTASTPYRPPTPRQVTDNPLELLDRARPITTQKVALAVRRVDQAHEHLRTVMVDHDAKTAARRELKAAEQRVREAQQQLAEARKRARSGGGSVKSITSPGRVAAARRAQAAAAVDVECRKCGRVCHSLGGRSSHERNCTGSSD